MYFWPTGMDMSDLHPRFGVMVRPADHCAFVGMRNGRWWMCDNEAFTRGVDPDRFMRFLKKLRPYRARCLAVVVPDVVTNAIATLESFRWWGWRLRAMGWPLAFVAQDGQENLPFPPDFNVLFIGGSTEWKMSPAADECIRRAKRLGRWIHVGRVNSISRFRHFQLIGADSCDGTFPAYEPDAARWRLTRAVAQNELFKLEPTP